MSFCEFYKWILKLYLVLNMRTDEDAAKKMSRMAENVEMSFLIYRDSNRPWLRLRRRSKIRSNELYFSFQYTAEFIVFTQSYKINFTHKYNRSLPSGYPERMNELMKKYHNSREILAKVK